MEKLNQTNVTEFSKGLCTDTSPQFQPKGTQRFVLNAVNESNLGDEMVRTNEESNEVYANIKSGYILLGKEYIGDNSVAIFMVSNDNTTSEIGILKGKNNYETHVNDATSSAADKLGFTIGKQIQATYRLRRGCERTVYFTDDNRKPGFYNFDKPQNFKNLDGTWSGNKFNLFRAYSSTPKFTNMEVSNSGGMLKPGSINVAIQLLDEGLNTSEWIITSDTVNIYNDSTTKPFSEISGSLLSDKDFLKFKVTTKSLKVTVSDLDTDWAYYRLAFIESNKADGLVSDVVFTDNLPITTNTFTYTGDNASVQGTQEEILFFNNVINRANSIEQIENRLVLANTQGKQVNMCKLQKYASRIQADCITKTVVLNDINDPSNPKNPLVNLNGTGYMPGEIYSFGIVYVFDDGTLSPVYHIPGRNNSVDDSVVYYPLTDVDNNSVTFPMSKDNEGTSVYTDNNQCDDSGAGVWGLDSEGDTLIGNNVRHHRFPLRTDINKPLVNIAVGDEIVSAFFHLELNVNGTLLTPVTCDTGDTGCTPKAAPNFTFKVSYKIDGIDESFIMPVNPAQYADNTGYYNINLIQNSAYHSSNIFTNIVIEITDSTGALVPADATGMAPYFFENLGDLHGSIAPTATTSIKNISSSVQGAVHYTDILGISFSNIDLPSIEDTNGEKIIGYYIVRNERGEFDKTIIDSGVMTPSLVNDKYISHGLLAPEVDSSKISKNVYGLIHPEHKFNNKEYTEYDTIIQQGYYNVTERKKSKIMYNDVLDGTSFQSGQKTGNDDGQPVDHQPLTRGLDGWSLTSINRDNIVNFNSKKGFEISKDKIEESFYLNALDSKDILDNTKSVFNIAADNKVGILHLNQDSLVSDSLPYVLLKRNNTDSYSNFRTLPYYKENNEMQDFRSGQCTIFNGDTYVTSMRYVNTLFWDNRIAKRVVAGSSVFGTFIPGGIGKWIAGAILIALGTILLAAGGSGALVIGAGIAIIGGGALFAASGIEALAVEKAYLQEYDKGLRTTALDNWVDSFYNFKGDISFGYSGNGGTGNDGPSDDTIEWVGDCITDLWFDSSINMALRNGMTSDVPTYLASPGLIESGNDTPINTWEFFGTNYTNGNSARYPVSKLDYHMSKKLLTTDQTRNDSKSYVGLPLGEYYNVNPDYMRKNKQKIYYHLPFSYDCCSECQEDFPHRWHWSEQSLQEELSDNYRTFLPNNYKDLEGQSGEITNVFRLNNDLFMHTKEALWKVPRNYQERVTDEIISFVGTGEYGSIPAQKIVDDDTGNSAGCQHKWGTIKTPEGIFFPSSNQGFVYQFDGNQLSPISNAGIGNWFKNNMNFLMDENYYESNNRLYPYRNNPSNKYGTGFVSTYDSRKQRVIFTKRDFMYSDITETDYELYLGSGGYIKFPNFSQTISTKETDGWRYVGIESSKMKFERPKVIPVNQTRVVKESIFKDADYLVFSYNFTQATGGRDLDTRTKLLSPTVVGPYGYAGSANTNGVQGAIFDMNNYLNWSGDNTGYGAESVMINVNKLKQDFPDATNIVFNAGAWWYPGNTIDGLMHMNAKSYKGGTMSLSTFLFSNTGGVLQGTYDFEDKVIPRTPVGSAGTPDGAANNIGNFTYTFATGDLSWDGASGGSTPPDVVETPTSVPINTLTTEYSYVDGVPYTPIVVDNSWTISYSLKHKEWVSWHSYMPNFYINTPKDFFSWRNGDNTIWKHNKKNEYQKFYGVNNPFIIEYVSLSNPLINKIWDDLKVMADVKIYDATTNEYYDTSDVFFTSFMAYNSRQCTGEKQLSVKKLNLSSSYLENQVVNSSTNTALVNRDEGTWVINELRDIRTNYNTPIFKSDLVSRQTNYFIDKVLNTSSMNIAKDWTEMESFRDKYLVVRLMFNNFAKENTKVSMNFSLEDETQSFR